jgi:hypothetical protein
LLGLRYSPEIARVLMRGVVGMKESTTYQAILEEGELKEARKILLLIGPGSLREPDAATVAAINALENLEALERMIRRLSQVHSWQELLGTPAPRRRTGRRRTDS